MSVQPTTDHDNAPTWRDLADQLTPGQVEKLARMEASSRSSAEETAAALLEGAREWALGNEADRVVFGSVARPSDAISFSIEETEPGVWTRNFDGATRRIDDAQVYITGRQYHDGRTERTIGIAAARGDYGAATARRIAAALIEAADEIERLA